MFTGTLPAPNGLGVRKSQKIQDIKHDTKFSTWMQIAAALSR